MSESLDNADTALTIVPAGVAAAGAIGSRVAPESVKRRVSAGRSWLQRNYDAFKNTHPRLFFGVNTLNAFFNLALYFADIYTDIVLLIDFIKYGWIYCAVWSVCFLVMPYLVAMGGILVVLKNRFYR